MADPVAFAKAQLDEEAAGFEAWVTGEIERLADDGVTVDREELLTDDPPHYKSPFRRPFRDIEAGRRILERHRDCVPWGGGPCDHAGTVGEPPCPDMRDLLARWADHPDYDESWKP